MALPDTILLETAYLPPVQYISKWLLHRRVRIEQHEHYQKGSYRNRCHIAGPNGVLRLSVPLQQGKNQQQPIREVAVAYREPWQHQHWHSIQSAYGNSPFFEFYADALQPFYERRYPRLFDFNLALLETCLELCGLPAEFERSEAYAVDPAGEALDFRGAIHPKARRGAPDPYFRAAPYPQVFQEKHGFLPNLSILDLLFCCGPQTPVVIESSIVNPKGE
jgi:hypothetical protein